MHLMGSYNSRRMLEAEAIARSESEDDSDQEIDYAAILQSLISRYDMQILLSFVIYTQYRIVLMYLLVFILKIVLFYLFINTLTNT